MKVVATDGAIAKAAGCEGCPDAGAHSAAVLTGDGYAEFTPAAGQRLFAGLSADLSAATASSTIDFAFSLWPDGAWEVRERGVYKKDGTFAPGDRFRVSVEAGRVVYRRNGVSLYTSATAPTYPLALDATLYSLGASLSGATVVVTSTVPTVVVPPPPPSATPPTGPPVITKTGPYEAVTDRLMHAKPALPVLGPAGSVVTDPVFGSRIMRVTDASTRPDSLDRSYKTPSSPHQNAWSATGTRFYVVGGGGAVLPYSFDAKTGTARRIQASASGAGGLVLNFYIEPQFSYVRDSIIYGSVVGGSLRTVDQYDFSIAVYSRLVDLDALVPGLAGTYIGGVASSSGPRERILTMFGGVRQDLHNYALVFDALAPETRQLLDTKASTVNGVPTATTLNFLLHHVMIDRSGRYVMLYPTGADQASARKAPQSVLWDTQANVFTEMPVSALPYGHDAFGYGVSVNKDCCTSSSYDAGQWQFRSLASPLVTRDVITTVLTPKEVYMSDHPTWNNARADNSAPFISGTYRHGLNTAPFRAWDDEIIAIQTDPAPGVEPTVWRFAHHRSDVTNDLDASATSFWYMPRPNVSNDGHWVLFTSNWEKTLGTDPNGDTGGKARQDVFLVALKSSVPPPPPVTVGSAALAKGRATVVYTDALRASGGRGTYRWAVTGGALPGGLSLDAATGAISGVPSVAGTSTFTVTVADAVDATNDASAAFAISVANAPVALACSAPSAGRLTLAYAT
ncbi:MAG TPA: Ig domain-containing protein, partial [Vicinamibacterales bacterium]|nr:Ig domain-containing protein [Vicinamibacterales bacterium]